MKSACTTPHTSRGVRFPLNYGDLKIIGGLGMGSASCFAVGAAA